MSGEYLTEVLLLCMIGTIGFIGRGVIARLESLRTDLHSIAESHGQRLAVLETRAELIRQGALHGNS